MKQISRRDFFYRTITTGVVGMGGGFISSVRTSARTPGPNSRLGIMIVGCGDRGYEHVKGYLGLPCINIIAVSDPDSRRMESLANIIKGRQGTAPACFRDFREGLSLSGLDIVSCAAPNHWHALCGILAMQAGKDVYLEKPLCHTIQEGKALLTAVRKYGRICQTGLQNRSTRGTIEGLNFISQAKMPPIKLVRAICFKQRASIGGPGIYPLAKTIDVNLWSGPAPLDDPCTRSQFHFDWNWQRRFGDGELGNQGAHQIDMARMILGVDEFPESVQTYGGRWINDSAKKEKTAGISPFRDAGDTANTEVVIFRYSGNKTLIVELRNLPSDRYEDMKLGAIAYGADGRKIAIVEYGRIQFCDPEGYPRMEERGAGNHFFNFIESCYQRRPEIIKADVRCGYLSACLTHLGNISYYLGENNKISIENTRKILGNMPDGDEQLRIFDRTTSHLEQNGIDLKRTPLSMGPLLKIDSKKESFIDNSDASQMEYCVQRKGFEIPNLEKNN